MFAASIESTEEGQVIHGKIIKVLKDFVAVDINKKSEGCFPSRTSPKRSAPTSPPGFPSRS